MLCLSAHRTAIRSWTFTIAAARCNHAMLAKNRRHGLNAKPTMASATPAAQCLRKTMQRKTVKQCRSCPWRVDCDPEQDIPNGYSCNLHEGLRKTIADGPSFRPGPLQVMACHYSNAGEEYPCAGWLYNQLGAGNNIGVRLAVMAGRMPVPEIDGEQHATFDETLPR
jgi:hypothetical protein